MMKYILIFLVLFSCTSVRKAEVNKTVINTEKGEKLYDQLQAKNQTSQEVHNLVFRQLAKNSSFSKEQYFKEVSSFDSLDLYGLINKIQFENSPLDLVILKLNYIDISLQLDESQYAFLLNKIEDEPNIIDFFYNSMGTINGKPTLDFYARSFVLKEVMNAYHLKKVVIRKQSDLDAVITLFEILYFQQRDMYDYLLWLPVEARNYFYELILIHRVKPEMLALIPPFVYKSTFGTFLDPVLFLETGGHIVLPRDVYIEEAPEIDNGIEIISSDVLKNDD